MAHRLETWFPNIVRSGYTITSPEDWSYNCFAFAVDDRENWWDLRRKRITPSMRGFWYDDVPPGRSIDALVGAYQKHHGFELCADGSLEAGFEKIAIYVDENDRPSHAAKQSPGGRWLSKAGGYEDFSHELHALEGRLEYGKVVVFLKRPHGIRAQPRSVPKATS